MKDKKNDVQQETKKPYATPKLTVYGDVAKITQTGIGPGGDAFDGSA